MARKKIALIGAGQAMDLHVRLSKSETQQVEDRVQQSIERGPAIGSKHT